MKKVLALIIAVLMLSSLVVVSTAAEDTVDWETVTNGIGANVYVSATTTAPTTDGVVADGEYTLVKVNATTDIYNYAGGEIQSEVTEYFAHDADYIYYACSFVQANDNRAFQWQFKPFNSFDIFRSNSDMTKYYYTRISWQARYKVDDEGFWTDYAGSYQPSINDNCVAVPTAVDETSELYCVSGKDTTTNVKTYEVRLAKSYIAAVNECEVADVRVIPYFTYFHSSAAVGHTYTADDLLTISDADYTVYLPSANELGYRFLVLDNGDDIGGGEGGAGGNQTTEGTTTEGTTTEGTTTEATTAGTTTGTTTAGTTAGTTTAKTTTAKTTTAAAADAEEDAKGCKGSIAISALVIAPVLAGGAVLLKKKED